jgi:hypothetical protein
MFKQLFIALTLLAIISFLGCEKKTEEIQDEIKSEDVSVDTTSSIDQPEIEESEAEEEMVVIHDVKGKWTGTFDKRSTVLNITEQTDSSFSGKISINYRQAINQDVKGTFSPTTMKMSMKDQLHSRYRGKYSGRLSEDGKNFSGTFTMDLDGSKLSFNLNKN